VHSLLLAGTARYLYPGLSRTLAATARNEFADTAGESGMQRVALSGFE